MKNPQTKRLIFCSLFLAILISTVAVLSCKAEDYPNISRIDSNLYLNANQQFFHRPGSGYVLISTNLDNETLASLLDSEGNLDYDCVRKPISFSFVYEKATLCGSFLYIAGKAPDTADCVQIERIDLNSGKHLMNKIKCVICDFSRDFKVDENGKLSLVTVPIGNVIEPDTQATQYIFNSIHNGACLDPQPIDPVSSTQSTSDSGNTSSDAPENTSSATSNASSAVSSQPEGNVPSLVAFNFDGPVTVESLQKELDTNALGQKLRVFTADKKEVKSGNIGTGQIVETVLDGKTESLYTAVIPGDLDGTGTVTDNDCQILYTYFTKESSSSSSVLSGPFFEAAKINDDERIDVTRNELHPSDLLKIKKLIK